MYAVIKTGGKQYRVQPGDVLVVEKLDGEAGAEVSFDQVLALGDAGEMTLGAPIVAGALVKATLIETRKGEKVKIFKKTRRQGYRRTRGHRQPESVLRVTSIAGEGKSADWDGTVDLTPLSVLNARARGLKSEFDGAGALPAVVDQAPDAPSAPPAAAGSATAEGAFVEQPISEVAPEGAETVANPEAQAGVGEQVGTEGAAPKKPRAKKAKATDDAAAQTTDAPTGDAGETSSEA